MATWLAKKAKTIHCFVFMYFASWVLCIDCVSFGSLEENKRTALPSHPNHPHLAFCSKLMIFSQIEALQTVSKSFFSRFLTTPRLVTKILSSSNSFVSGSAIVWRQNVTLGPQEDLSKLKVNDTLTVNLAGSGLSESSDLFTLYVRAARVELWKFLASTDRRVSVIYGPHGIGKSIDVYVYALWEAYTHHKRVLYFTSMATTPDIPSSWREMDLTISALEVCMHSWIMSPDFLWTLLTRSSSNRKSMSSFLMDKCHGWSSPNVRMISCTSAEVTANISTGNMAKNPKFSKFMMDSWKKEECYRYGGIDPRFTNLDYGRDVLLRRRLHSYDAMASRRCHHFSDSQDKIRTWYAQARRRWGLWGFVTDAMNSLMAFYDGRSVVLSKFVAMKMLNSVTDLWWSRKPNGFCLIILPCTGGWRRWRSCTLHVRILPWCFGMFQAGRRSGLCRARITPVHFLLSLVHWTHAWRMLLWIGWCPRCLLKIASTPYTGCLWILSEWSNALSPTTTAATWSIWSHSCRRDGLCLPQKQFWFIPSAKSSTQTKEQSNNKQPPQWAPTIFGPESHCHEDLEGKMQRERQSCSVSGSGDNHQTRHTRTEGLESSSGYWLRSDVRVQLRTCNLAQQLNATSRLTHRDRPQLAAL